MKCCMHNSSRKHYEYTHTHTALATPHTIYVYHIRYMHILYCIWVYYSCLPYIYAKCTYPFSCRIQGAAPRVITNLLYLMRTFLVKYTQNIYSSSYTHSHTQKMYYIYYVWAKLHIDITRIDMCIVQNTFWFLI